MPPPPDERRAVDTAGRPPVATPQAVALLLDAAARRLGEADRVRLSLLQPALLRVCQETFWMTERQQGEPVTADEPGPPAADSELRQLSAREREVMEAVGHGLHTAQIATALHISSRTVGKHLEHVYAKLGVTDRTAAAMVWAGARRRDDGPREPRSGIDSD